MKENGLACVNALDSNIFKNMRPTQKWRTLSPTETMERGRLIGRTLQPGTVVALIGELGSGKTTLVKGLARGLGVKSAREVKSPTFVIFHIYKGRVPLYHFDLYRLGGNLSDLETIGIGEYLADPGAVSVIEWADRVPGVSEQADIKIKLSRASEKARIIRVDSRAR